MRVMHRLVPWVDALLRLRPQIGKLWRWSCVRALRGDFDQALKSVIVAILPNLFFLRAFYPLMVRDPLALIPQIRLAAALPIWGHLTLAPVICVLTLAMAVVIVISCGRRNCLNLLFDRLHLRVVLRIEAACGRRLSVACWQNRLLYHFILEPHF